MIDKNPSQTTEHEFPARAWTPIADFVESTGASRCDFGPNGTAVVLPDGTTHLFLNPKEDDAPYAALILDFPPLTARVLSSFLHGELFPGLKADVFRMEAVRTLCALVKAVGEPSFQDALDDAKGVLSELGHQGVVQLEDWT